MGKLPDWVPDDEEIAGVIRGECWDVGGGDSRRAARAIRELLERKAGEPDGKRARDDDHDACGGCGGPSYLWMGAIELRDPPVADCVWVRDGSNGMLEFDCAKERALYAEQPDGKKEDGNG